MAKAKRKRDKGKVDLQSDEIVVGFNLKMSQESVLDTQLGVELMVNTGPSSPCYASVEGDVIEKPRNLLENRTPLEETCVAVIQAVKAGSLSSGLRVALVHALATDDPGMSRDSRVALLTSVMPCLEPLLNLAEEDLDCLFCMEPVDLHDPSSRYVTCCPGARFACGGCVAVSRGPRHPHALEVEVGLVRLAAAVQKCLGSM